MPCQPSHTKGPGADEYQADEAEKEFNAEPEGSFVARLREIKRSLRTLGAAMIDEGALWWLGGVWLIFAAIAIYMGVLR